MPSFVEQHPSLWFTLLFGAAWLLVGSFLSWCGGWTRLARLPQSGSVAPKHSYFFVSASFALHELPVFYRHCLFVGFDSHGIAITVLPLFRFYHPPLLIPWSRVVDCTRRRRLFSEQTTLVLSEGLPTLRFYGALGDGLHQFFQAKIRLPPPRLAPDSPVALSAVEGKM